MENEPLTPINCHPTTHQDLYNQCATVSTKIQNQAVNTLTAVLITPATGVDMTQRYPTNAIKLSFVLTGPITCKALNLAID